MKDYKKWYEEISAPIRKNDTMVTLLREANRQLTKAAYVAYPVCLFCLYQQEDKRLLPAVLVPAIFFMLVSLFRNLVNRKRPYETFDIDPLIVKDSSGKSMPSRHVFSMTIIAMVFLWIHTGLGVLFLTFAFLLAIVRVLGGVHYVSDVLAGLVIGILSGGILFFI